MPVKSFTVSGNTPITLDNKYAENISQPFDPVEILRKLFANIWVSNGAPVTIVDNSNNQQIGPDEFIDMIVGCCDENFDADLEASTKDILRQVIRHYSPNDEVMINDLFSTISAVAVKAPLPSNKPGPTFCQYTADDILEVSKEFLAGAVTVDQLRAYFGFYCRTQCLAWYFRNETEFDNFKNWFDQLTTPMASFLTQDTLDIIQDFKLNVKLSGLTESLLLRRDDTDNTDPYAFARLMVHALMTYNAKDTDAGIIPMSFGEFFCPRALVFVNLERHARASVAQIQKEWKLIKQSILSPLKIYSAKKINKLTTAAHMIQKAQAQGAKGGQVMKAARFKIKKTAPQTPDVINFVKKIYKKTRKVLISENPEIIKIKTFNRPNRRHPDDPTKMGTLTNTRYNPDIHVYADTSGSISDQDYAVTMKVMIQLAKALNVNLYFNSWSTQISACTKIPTRGKSVEEIYKMVIKIPKVTGGTDIEPVWRYINASKKRKREISIVTTDFGIGGISNRGDVVIPKHCYYIPTTNDSWRNISYEIEQFIKQTSHIDPTIPQKICM